VSEEAIPSAENSGNLWAVGAPPWTPLGELTALPETPSWCGEGACCSLPKNRTHELGIRPRFSALRSWPQWKILGTPLHN